MFFSLFCAIKGTCTSMYINGVNVHVCNLYKHKPMSKLASVASLVALVCDSHRMSFHFLSLGSMRIKEYPERPIQIMVLK
jgi:hypothetical protein